jgi:hypothetical protein
MNEKIKELEVQCWEPTQYGPAWFNSTKFAELLIRKCAGVCLEQRQYQPKEVYAQAVLSHFGVEE